jgi:uncharacterized protein (TIGR03382 family)
VIRIGLGLGVGVACALPALARAAPVLQESADPHPGIHRERWVDSAVPATIHLVRVDLSLSTIAVIATDEASKGSTPSEFATLVGAQLAINGDFFAAADFAPRGLAVGAGAPWSQTADTPASGVIQLDRGIDRARISIIAPEVPVDPAELPPENEGVVSGRPLLVRAGVVQPPQCSDPETLACTRAPRTAVGLSADGNTLLLAVVDGWQAGSDGLTANELAGFLAAQGARNAIGLDVGSSSALVLDGALVSSPSDGVERAVANHIAIKSGNVTTGQLVGLICLRSIFDCTTTISGATVTLDDGSVDVTAANGIYDFPAVPPRWACVDVTAQGYDPAHKCRQVQPGEKNYNSVALFPTGETPDAGPRPDGGFPAGDGPGGGDPGGCCDAGGAPPGGTALVIGVVAAALGRRRRRQ